MNAQADHDAYLRAALHAAADSLEPRGDGLERIRARLQHTRPRAIVWLHAAWDTLRLRAPAALQDAFYRLDTGLLAAWDRFVPAVTPGKHRSRAEGWLRPLAAMAVVIFIVAAGTYVAIDVSTAVSPSSSNSHPRGGQPGAGGGHPTASPSLTPSHPASSAGSGTRTRHPSASPTCLPSASPGPSALPGCASATSPEPSPSASVSPSPSPTPTPSASTSNGSSPSPQPS
jgi:hypothetical protein